jgi:hypothetical protein
LGLILFVFLPPISIIKITSYFRAAGVLLFTGVVIVPNIDTGTAPSGTFDDGNLLPMEGSTFGRCDPTGSTTND